MADKRFLDLPAELRMLVDLFEEDDRATAIVELEQINGSLIYENHAFRCLACEEGSQKLAQRVAAKHGGQTPHQVQADGSSWRCKELAGQWMSLVCVDNSRIINSKVVSCENEQTQLAHDLGSKHDGEHPLPNDNTGMTGLLDWTSFDVPNVSPWTEFVRNRDWSSTLVGPMHIWPFQLRQYMVAIMSNPAPRLFVYGTEMVFFYNEACAPLFGVKHPECFGKPILEHFAEVWDDVGAMLREVYDTGKTLTLKRLPVSLKRSEITEETYWDFSLLPIMDFDGRVTGVIDELVESTSIVRGERRRASVLRISEEITAASTLKDLWSRILVGLQHAVEDVPFAMFYAVADDVPDSVLEFTTCGSYCATNKKCVLEGTVGVAADNASAIQMFSLTEHTGSPDGIAKSCFQAWKTGQTMVLSSVDATLPASLATANPGRSFGDSIHKALVTPIRTHAGDRRETLGILVMGMNSRCPYDEEYTLWAHLVAELAEKAATLITLPEEQRRAQKIADDINSALAQQLKTTTLQAEQNEAKFSKMAESAPTGMYMFDREGRPIYVNDAYLKIFQETREQHAARALTTADWRHSIHVDDYDRFMITWNGLLERSGPMTIEYRLKRPWTSTDWTTGQQITGETWVLANAIPEVDSDGEVVTVRGWITDISYRKFSEKLVAQRLEDALENKRQSENFIDMTSHEMRNPLSAILQSADSIVSALNSAGMPILEEAMKIPFDVADDVVDAAQTIILCAQHQKRIIDDILTLSKLDARLLVISPDKVQPPCLVEKALKMYESEIVRADITANLCVEPSYNELNVDWVMLDPSRLLQVIINLLTNAIKFTQYSDTRKITICLGASYERPTGKHHGVDFIPVRRLRPSIPQPDVGDGEDLYLQIAVSDSGSGLTEDEMKLLFQRFQQATPKTYQQYGGSGLGLFISRELSELQGGQIGVSSCENRTTFTFFVKTKRWVEPNDKLSVPTLKAFASTSASPIIYDRRGSVAPTVIASEEKQSFDAAASIAAINASVTQTADQALVAEVKEDKEDKNGVLHVLVVEDNLINQKVMSQQLRKAGCVVHVANHGVECLDFLEESSFCDAITPLSVVLLDLEMPVMGGLTCVRHIRERQANGQVVSHVPVIAVTANARSEQISGAIEAGMDRVVTKPFRISELMPQIRTLIEEVAQRDVT